MNQVQLQVTLSVFTPMGISVDTLLCNPSKSLKLCKWVNDLMAKEVPNFKRLKPKFILRGLLSLRKQGKLKVHSKEDTPLFDR